MRGTLKPDASFVNVKTATGVIIGAIKPGDAVYGTLDTARTNIYFTKIYRADGTIQELGQLCNSVVENLILTDVPEPIPGPAPEPTPEPPPVTNTMNVTVVLDDTGEIFKGTLTKQ